MDETEFVSNCQSIMKMVQSLNDEIVQPGRAASFDSLDEFSEDYVNSFDGDKFIFSIMVNRNGLIYTILGSPAHEYFEVIFEHTLNEALLINSTLDDSDVGSLSEEEQMEKIENADVTNEEIEELLSESRNASLDVINSKINTELVSQTDCSVRISRTQDGDVFGVETIKKLFVSEDDFSIADLEDAVVAVVNVGRKSVFLLSQLYDLDSVSPESLVDLRSASDESRYHQ